MSLSGRNGGEVSSRVDTVWMEVHWVNYGPFGRLSRREGVVVPLRRPAVMQQETATFRSGDGCSVLPLKTHLLGPLDNTIDVLRHYAGDLVQSGDILTIGETPVAVIQGRYTHPCMVQPSWIARLLCRVFHPTSSLATACGLQTLIDQVGPTRVILAWSIGLALKLIGLKGWFYRLAGDQARLIDDITGTTPPYDQTIVLGPQAPKQLCDEAAACLGVSVAIVDVNDLGRVKVRRRAPAVMRSCCIGHCARTRPATPMSALPWCWCDPSESQQTKVSDTLRVWLRAAVAPTAGYRLRVESLKTSHLAQLPHAQPAPYGLNPNSLQGLIVQSWFSRFDDWLPEPLNARLTRALALIESGGESVDRVEALALMRSGNRRQTCWHLDLLALASSALQPAAGPEAADSRSSQ